jgi:hypothetical protein
MTENKLILDIIDLCVKLLVLIIGAGWALYKIKEYREFKYLMQLDIDANIIKLTIPEKSGSFTWNEKGIQEHKENVVHTHLVEINLKYSNKGKTRIRLYNIQVGVNTMRPPGDAKIDPSDGRLVLKRIYTSGNIVPIYKIANKPIHKTSFYYIEPGVEQNITHVCLISEPLELIQVFAKSNLDQSRLFPEVTRGSKKLYPQSIYKIYALNKEKNESTY